MIDDILRTNLKDGQYDAVVDNATEVLCLACAGSGKSRTLAYRIARLIAEGNSPQSIIAFTFTDKAAESIKRRVADALEKCGLPVAIVGGMYIGTIHSYCQHLLGKMDASYIQFEVLDDNRLKLFLLSRYYELGLREVSSSRNARFFQTISEVSEAWKIANDELIDYNDIETESPELGRCIRKIFERLNRDQFIDFSLMIRHVVEALKNNSPKINKALEGIKYLLVDEYQDVNPSQDALIKGIYKKTGALFVVGDDDQSIYGWRGADVRNIIDFQQNYPSCSFHNLNTNFRSTRCIVEVSNNFIQMELGPQRIDKTPVSHSDGNIRQVGNFWFSTKQEEAEWVANRINSLIGTEYIDNDGVKRGLTKSDFAILLRSVLGGTRGGRQPHHTEYTTALNRLGIQYTIEAEGSIFDRPYAGLIRDAMELLREPGVLRSIVVNFFNSQVIPLFPNANLSQFVSVLSDWNNQIHTPAGGSRRKVYPQKLVHDLLEAFGIKSSNFDDTIYRDLGVFSSIILDIEKVFISIDSTNRYRDILNFLQNVAETGYDTTQVELLSRPDAVTVSTVHKMKGLEFPVVFIVDVVNLRFPKTRSNYNGWLPQSVIQNALNRGMYQTNQAGEARLFYTALTRAERFLYVTGSALQQGLKKQKNPSLFKLRLTHDEIITSDNLLPQNIVKAPEKRRIDDNSMPTSFTEIKDYLECPMKYKFRKLYGFSPAVPELFGFGLTTHTSINKLHQVFPNIAPTETQAQEIVNDVFHLKHVFQSGNPANPGPFERAKEKAKEIVSKYAIDYPEDFTQNRELEVRFEIKADRALITGAIDLLLKEDTTGKILDAKVVDFKSMDYPEDMDTFFWINLALQVQLYAHASQIVLGENAKTGAVHLLKAGSNGHPARVEIPISDAAISSAVENIKWAVNQILNRDFPKRPNTKKCENCDFTKICSKNKESFLTSSMPPEILIPNLNGVDRIMVGAFSDVT